MDLVGPLPSSRGFTHLFTIMDKTSRWPKVVPLSLTSAEDCARAWFPVGSQSLLFQPILRLNMELNSPGVLCSLLNISCSRTTSFHPQSNCLVERFHRSLKTTLQARLADPYWFDYLPLVMLELLHVTDWVLHCQGNARCFSLPPGGVSGL